ncbi:MAG: hypothetical protein HFG61_09975 [Lachnospiraceae bacterium]|nr:hypothetical protein [Lachnospiraceae bacterium]
MKKSTRAMAWLTAAAVFLASVPAAPLRAQAEGDAISIRTVEDFLEFSRSCTSESYSQGKTVSLEADLDLTGVDFCPIPVFCGTFEGNSHTVSGVSIVRPGSNLGLFRYLEETAVVQNLNVQGDLKPQGSRKKIGGIAGTNKGAIKNCTFSGKGQALENLGGIAGLNEATGVIENCKNLADLEGNRRIGGIAGENAGIIQDSHNEGAINIASEGLYEDPKEKNTISMDRESIHETIMVEKVNDVGGIAGLSSGTIRQCGNLGDIGYSHTGYNIGGIAGRQNGLLVLCDNEGDVAGRKDVGGIVGQLEPFLMVQYGEDTFDRIHGQVDRISDTTDAMGQELRHTTDASIGNLDRVDEIVKQIRDITRDKKDDRRGKRKEYDEKAGRQLDLIDEILAETELDLGSRTADQSESRLRANLTRARKLLESLGGAGGGQLPDDYIPDEDAGVLENLQRLHEILSQLEECGANIAEEAEVMVEARIDGVVEGVQDFEDDLDSLRVASKEFLDLTREYKDQLFDDVDVLDEDLTGQLDQLYDELDFLSDNLKSGKDQLRAEKDRLDGQLDQMQDILVEGKERVQAERERVEDDEEPLFEDISEMASDLANGMIVGCSNQGGVFSDFQAGGVVGTIGIELDLDPEEDIEAYGEESLYMNRYAQASVRGCRNQGDITVQQDYAGGIAGTARIGVLASNQNYGDVLAADGNYAGGIAGSSQSTITGSYAMCQVEGNDYIGGIAGFGKSLKNNCAMVDLAQGGGEWMGSIAGGREETGTVQGNLYVDDGLGAVDGVTFQGEAQGVSYEELLQREGVPPEFRSLTVTFLADGQVVERVACRYGQSLSPEEMPQIPSKPGFFHHWEETGLPDIRKNYKIHAVYVPWTTTIASGQAPMPPLLAEGAFYPNARLLVQEREKEGLVTDSLPGGYREVAVYHYEVRDEENPSLPSAVKLHILAGGADSVAIVQDGRAEKVDVVKDGQYLIFEAGASGDIVLLKSRPTGMIFLAIVAAVTALAAIGKKKRGLKNVENHTV